MPRVALALLLGEGRRTMDRYDEKKDISDTDEVGAREGETLGLDGSTVPKMPEDPRASEDPLSVRKRRERASGDEDSGVRHEESRRTSTEDR
jgi:hypothetical protein